MRKEVVQPRKRKPRALTQSVPQHPISSPAPASTSSSSASAGHHSVMSQTPVHNNMTGNQFVFPAQHENLSTHVPMEKRTLFVNRNFSSYHRDADSDGCSISPTTLCEYQKELMRAQVMNHHSHNDNDTDGHHDE